MVTCLNQNNLVNNLKEGRTEYVKMAPNCYMK